MNKLLVLLFLAIPFIGKSQFNKGDMFVGGLFILSNQTSSGNNNGTTKNDAASINITPRFGYFLNGKWAIGGGLGYGYSTSAQEYGQPNIYAVSQHSHTISLSATALARRYIPISEKFFFSIEGGTSFARSTTTNTSIQTNYQVNPPSTTTTTTDVPGYTLSASIRPVFVFFPSPHWALEAGLGSLYFNYQHNLSTDASTSTMSLSAASSTSFGIYYYFRKE